MVYVLDIDGDPLMPTERHGKVRRLLKEGRAKVVKLCPFTIQLLYDSTKYTQDVNLGVDAGSKHIGVSATTAKKELYSADVELRSDVVDLISTRKECRIKRRNRKTRYRETRFLNRVSNMKTGWLAPSVRQKIQCHLTTVKNICSILPIKNIIVETASFDIQKIKNPEIQYDERGLGEQFGFFNTRQYVLFRDNYTCQCCKGRSKDSILNVHHIQSRKIGGNAPNNLVTLCKTCHTKFHNGEISLPKNIKRKESFRDAAFMGLMRDRFVSELKNRYRNVSVTYGYITKSVRILYNLPKEHYIDARCISGNPEVKPLGYYFYQKKTRCHNRQIHKMKISKGNIRRNNQTSYKQNGFRLFDKVKYNNNIYFIIGRRKSGYFDIRDLNWNKKTNINYKKLKFIEERKSYLTQMFQYKQDGINSVPRN